MNKNNMYLIEFSTRSTVYLWVSTINAPTHPILMWSYFYSFFGTLYIDGSTVEIVMDYYDHSKNTHVFELV